MMPMVVDRIASVGEVPPNRVRKKFILGFVRPIEMPSCVDVMFAKHFLQKHHVGTHAPQPITQLMNNHA